MTAAEIAGRLEARRSGDGRWRAHCRACDPDRRKPRALSIAEGREGRTLMQCFRCHGDIDDLATAAGLEMSDLFPPRAAGERWRPTRRQPQQSKLVRETIAVLDAAGRRRPRGLRHMSSDQLADLSAWIAELHEERDNGQ